jgi:predicted nucleic acid-binding protein
VLQGFNDERAFHTARESMLAMPMVESPIQESLVLEAVDLYRVARRNGATVRSSVDCLIAASAIRHQLIVVHVDRDYDHIAKVSPLQTRRLRLKSARRGSPDR